MAHAAPSERAFDVCVGGEVILENVVLQMLDAALVRLTGIDDAAAAWRAGCQPTIIGAKVARPDRPAVAYAGDGAWGMSMSEILTSVRHDIPVTAVVFHNRDWGAEKKNQVEFYDRRFVAAELENESWAGIARAMGAEGIRVDQLDEVDRGWDALRTARGLVAIPPVKRTRSAIAHSTRRPTWASSISRKRS